VGYDEPRSSGNDKTGSHNIVLGTRNNYSSYGGLVAGRSNEIGGVYASVSGGRYNTAGGNSSSVSGGYDNTANGDYSSISEGQRESAGGQYDWKVGNCYFCDW